MNAIITKREFNVPVEMLYRAFSHAEHMQHWWGPEGFTNTFYEYDFRSGGKWHFTMHGPDGKAYENESEFEIITANERVVLRHISKPEYRAEFLFTASGINKSALTWNMVFATEKAYQSLKDIVAEKNEENLNRLDNELKKMKP